MATYTVTARYDMGMTYGSETIRFEAKDDDAARSWIQEREGGDLSDIKRGVEFDSKSLSRVIGT